MATPSTAWRMRTRPRWARTTTTWSASAWYVKIIKGLHPKIPTKPISIANLAITKAFSTAYTARLLMYLNVYERFKFVFELIYTILLLQHNTDGPNCETCLPDHWDVRWQRATQADANECKGQCSDGFMVGKSFD